MTQDDVDAAWRDLQKTLGGVRTFKPEADDGLLVTVFTTRGEPHMRRDPSREGQCPKHPDAVDDRHCQECGEKECNDHSEAKAEADRYCPICGQEKPKQAWVELEAPEFLSTALMNQVAATFGQSYRTLVVKEPPRYVDVGVVRAAFAVE